MSLRKKMIWDIQYLEEGTTGRYGWYVNLAHRARNSRSGTESEWMDASSGLLHSSRQCAWLSSQTPRNGILLSYGLTPRVP